MNYTGITLEDGLYSFSKKSPTSAKLSLEIPTEPQGILLARHVLELFLKQAGVSEEDSDAMKIAVGEACSNVVKYGYSRTGINTLNLSLLLDEETLTVEVKDHGKGFDLNNVSEPSIENLPENGMGIFLMKRVMDQVVFRFTTEGTQVSLHRKLRRRPVQEIL